MPAKVEVSIPVHVGGNTGQFDRWESSERNYTVYYAAGAVTLADRAGNQIIFALDDLHEAIQFSKNEQGSQHDETS